MVIEIRDADSGDTRKIVDWKAGSPVYLGDEIESVPPPEPLGPWLWPLKPGDIVCDWFNVTAPDNRGLLRMTVNLTLYAKIVAVAVVLAV